MSNINPYKWHDVYIGIENSYVDIQLLTGTKYEYRVQAWNSVGRSQWTVGKYETPGEEVEGCMKVRIRREFKLRMYNILTPVCARSARRRFWF